MNLSNSAAIYFPGEFDYLRRDYGTRQLKKVCVYFDRILTLVPETTFTGDNWVRGFQGYGRRSARVETFLKETTTLREKGILTCINPTENVYPRDTETHFYSLGSAQVSLDNVDELSRNIAELLFTSIVADLGDQTFRAIVEELRMEPIPVYTGQLEINWFSMLAYAGHQRDMWEHPDPDHGYGGFSAMVSPQLGASVILNHALITSIRYGALPVAGNRQFDRLLRHKLSRIKNVPGVEELMQETLKKASWSRDLLAKKVLEVEIPDFELETFDDVLEFREKAKNELESFRSHLYQASEELRQAPITEVETVAQGIVEHQIRPALLDLERKLQLTEDKFFLRALKGLKSAKTSIPLIATVFVGLPLWLGVALSAGATITEAALETYFEKRAVRESNGLSFLLNLRS